MNNKVIYGIIDRKGKIYGVQLKEIMYLSYLGDVKETRHLQFSKQSEMNLQTLNLSFEHTSTGHIKTMCL